MASSGSGSFPDHSDFDFAHPVFAHDMDSPSLGIPGNATLDVSYGDLFDFETLGLDEQDLFGAPDLAGFSSLSALDMSFELEPTPAPEMTPVLPLAHTHSQAQTNDKQKGKEKESQDVNAEVYPPRNPSLRLHTPPPDSPAPSTALASASAYTAGEPGASTEAFQIGYPLYPIPVDANGNPDPLILKSLGLPQLPSRAPAEGSSRAGPSRSRTRDRDRDRDSATPYASAKKVKAREENTWHVITPPPSATLPQTTAPEPSNARKRSNRRRKDVFQHVERPTTHSRGEWFEPKPIVRLGPWFPPKRKDRRGPHSDMGWVLARLREPDCARAKYGWAIAEVNDPRRNAYLVLSGPHATKIKMVREFDRIAYSPDAIAELRATNARRNTQHREEIYDTIMHDPHELSLMSSAYGTSAAAVGMEAIP